MAEKRYVLRRGRNVRARPHSRDRGFLALTPAIEARGLAKRYGAAAAVNDLTLSVAPGEVFGFLGPNGAGKTTAVKMLLGLVHPSGGAAHVLGKPLGDRRARRAIGYLPELFRYQEWLTAREVLAFHGALLGVDARRRRSGADGVLDLVGLRARGGERVGTYSKGMQQRLGIAVALLGDPRLVVLDEPTSALDPVGRRDVRDLLASLRARGVTVFLNSHLLTEVERICDRVAIVDRGSVIASGAIASIVGTSRAVRIRASGGRDALESAAARFGTVVAEDGWMTIGGIDAAAIPDAVAALIGAGARISAVEPLHATLEDRFMELVREP
ncbi:MAG: ABC transporter ATP-binding protein [Candidatus Velthaea sp.]